MKTNLRTAFVLLIALFSNYSFAQITNNGFENWTTTGSYQEPNGWATMNPYCSGPFYSCTKSSDHFPANVGSYSLRVENNTSLSQSTGGWGLSVTGPMNYPIKPAFAISGHPVSLNGYYKYTSMNSDSMWVNVILFNGGSQVMSESFRTGVSASSWTPFTLNFSSYAAADSGFIMIGAFYPSGPASSGPKGNSVLYLDNLSFDTFITGVKEISSSTTISVYPNPANDKIILNFSSNESQHTDVEIYNALGERVLLQKNINAKETSSIDVSKFFEGAYFLKATTENGSVYTKKVIISR